jgi:hypothetical protein
LSLDQSDAGDDAGRGGLVVVEAPGGQWTELKEGAARIHDSVDPLPSQQLATLPVAGYGLDPTGLLDAGQALAELLDERAVVSRVLLEFPRFPIDSTLDDRHRVDYTNPPAVSRCYRADGLRAAVVGLM